MTYSEIYYGNDVYVNMLLPPHRRRPDRRGFIRRFMRSSTLHAVDKYYEVVDPAVRTFKEL